MTLHHAESGPQMQAAFFLCDRPYPSRNARNAALTAGSRPGDGHPCPAAHPELPGGELSGGGKVDHIGAMGLQKTGIGQQGFATSEKGTRREREATSSPLARW